MLSLSYVGEYDTYNVEFDRNDHVVTLKGDFPVKTTGFYLSRIGKRDNLDYTAFTTVYRKIGDGVQFSDDGSVYVDPVHDVVVEAVWNDADDADKIRPSSVNLVVNGKKTVLKASEDWKKVYKDLKESETVTVDSAEAVEGYEITISGTTVTYFHNYEPPVDPEPSLEERVSDLEAAVIDLYEMREGE